MEVILWKSGQYRSARKAFRNAMSIGERLGTRLELSRTYLETGRFLSDPKSRSCRLNGHDAGYYLGKAGKMFEEMGLERDLEFHEV